MTSSWTGAPREVKRLSKADIEHNLLETAKKLIHENGLTVSLEHLRLDELMELADVPKTSFYRVWDSKEAFFARLLEELVLPDEFGGAAFDPETQRIGREVVENHPEMLATAETRKQLLLEAIRLGAERNYVALTESLLWKTYTVVRAALRGMADVDTRDRLQAALRAAELHFINRMATFYAELLPVLNYQLKPGITTEHIAAVGAAVVEGLVQRSLVIPEIADVRVPGPALDGGVTDWHLAAVGFRGVIEMMAEPSIDEDTSQGYQA